MGGPVDQIAFIQCAYKDLGHVSVCDPGHRSEPIATMSVACDS